MSTITKEWLQQKIADMEATRDEIPFGLDEDDINTLAALRIALASREAEPSYFINRVKRSDAYGEDVELRTYCYELDALKSKDDFGGEIVPVYTAPTAPVSVPDENDAIFRPVADLYGISVPGGRATTYSTDSAEASDCRVMGWGVQEYVKLEHYQAAMLHGADTELKRKAAVHDALCERYNVESLTDFVDWQRNHIAELEAAPPVPVGAGETAVMPDYPGYVMTQRECYQAGKKAGLAEAGNAPAIPDGWVLVPKEPTPDMLNAAWVSHGIYHASAYRTMLAAAPQQE
ncbi:hypothetical protein [Enterobacter cloacae]